ncbi:MAG TPA: ComEC/Rec2 family competence protein [Candidatus Saccharimonadales bacterium]|nr:ComEC/Rec2 family competence protein [Candidatus Saccharimonadales bacterium]
MQRLLRHRFRRTTLLTAAYAAFLIGVGLARGGRSADIFWSGLLAVLLGMFRKKDLVTLLLAVGFAGSLGLWRGEVYVQKLAAYQPYYGQAVTLSARATEDAVYSKNSQLSFDANHIQLDDGTELTGKIELGGFGLDAIYQGDEVQASGKLYPGFGAYQGRISFAQLSLVRHHPSLVASIRRKFAAGMQSALPEPLASFAMGLLIGQRATLPDDVKQDLLMVGLTHIIAVSGYNLTIMLEASRGMFGRASKRLATLGAFALIGAFLLLAGSSASIVRAAIVSMLSIMVGYYGRSFKPLNLIMLAGAITAWANPFYIWSDVSWYLSFLAFYGVMVLAPALSERIQPGRAPPLALAVALESICAEIMTLPYVLHVFGQMSLIGLPANVLVVTLVPLAMLLSTVAGLAGMLTPSLAGWLSWPAKLLLTYMLDVAHLLSRVPHIFLQNLQFGIGQMLAMYVVIIALSLSLSFKLNTKNGKITDRKESSEKHVRTFQMVND